MTTSSIDPNRFEDPFAMTIPRWYLLIPVVLGLLCAAGCVSTEESEMPWNTPQSWEGTPGIPGLSPTDR
ncbi:MAG: hypothetical protein WCS01_04815 [bacterium]